MNPVLLGILGYVALQLAIAWWVSRRIASEADYLLAGRSIGLGLASFSIFATWFGAETCIGAAGTAYTDGVSAATAEPFGYGACLIIMGFVFAVPLYSRGITTLADLFRSAFSPGVERLAALLMIPTSVLWAGAQVRAFGQIVHATAGVDVLVGTSIASAAVIVYTVRGGMLADVYNDLLQGLVIIAGLIILTVAVITANPGIQIAPDQISFVPKDTSWLETIDAWAIPICGSVVAQELVARVMAARSGVIAKRALLSGGSLYLLVGLIPVFLGLLGPQLLPNLEDPESILPALAKTHLNTIGYVVFAGAIVAAILSTVDSTLLAASSLLSHNIILPLNPGMTERRKILWARSGVIAFGFVAFSLALTSESVHDLVQTASSFGSSGIFVIFLAALFWKRLTPLSAYLALSLGVLVWIAGTVAEWPAAYLISLGASFAGYLLGLCKRA